MPEASPEPSVVETVSESGEAVEAPQSAKTNEAPVADAAVAGSSNALGFDLYAKIRAGNGNLAFSPASVMAALAMTYGGADGETRAEMAKVLRLDPSVDGAGAVGTAFAGLTKQAEGGLVLRMANRLFGDATQKFEPVFLQATAKAFAAPLETMDFRTAAEPARVAINEWVAKETERKIENLIPTGGVDADTRLVLVNAVYFLGKWQAAFEKNATRPETFHLPGGATKSVPMMHASGHRLYGEADGVKLLEMGYRDSDFAMLFVLPNAKNGLGDVEAKLSPAVLEQWAGALSGTMTDVALPKFKIEPAQALSLSKALKDLGMIAAFDRARADFTRMAKPTGPGDRLSIGDVFHKAFVAVDEEGTEAAAATAVTMRTTGAMLPVEDKKEFRADRPFLFFLRHKPSGLVLFMGRVADPAP